MSDMKFSVSMCVYEKDDPIWFDEAVQSVLNQTVKPDEVVLVVDGPVPNELETVIAKYERYDFFRIVRFTKNRGHGHARREGLLTCKYDIVALMDSDDICANDRFEKQLDIFLNDTSIDIVGGNITEFIGEPHNIVAKREVPCNDVEIKKYMTKRCPMNQVTVMFKKKSVEAVGGYIDWYCEEDYYLWVRMALNKMKFANTPDILVNVRVGKEMYQRRGGYKYFVSEAKLQKYMLDNKLIGLDRYILNVLQRFIVQIVLPNKVRGFVFKKFARKKV